MTEKAEGPYRIKVVRGVFQGDVYPDFKSVQDCDAWIVDERRKGLTELFAVGTMEIQKLDKYAWHVVGER